MQAEVQLTTAQARQDKGQSSDEMVKKLKEAGEIQKLYQSKHLEF